MKLADFSFQNVYSPIAFIREDGSFFYFNEATASLFGYSTEEFNELTVFDINPTDNPSKWQFQWNEIRQNIKLILYSKLQKRNGSWMDIEVRTNWISFGDIELNCTFYTDITEKKKIDEQLKLVDFTFRHATTAIQLIRDDHTIYDFNEAMPIMLGYTKEEYKKITLLDLDPYKNAVGWSLLWSHLKSSKALELQRKLRRKDGSLIDVEMSVDLIKYGDMELNCAFITDITENKKIHEKLKLVNFAFNNASTPIFFVKEDGSIYDYNLSAVSLFGYSKEELMNLRIFDIDPTTSPEIRKGFWEDLKAKRTILQNRRFLRKDGSWMDIELKSNSVNYSGMQFNCAFIADITEKKKIEEHLNVVDFSFQNASTPILLVKRDGTFYDFNLATLALFGYTSEEMKVLHVFDIDPDADDETRRKIWDTISASGTLLHYRQMKKKNGEWMTLELRANMIKKGGRELNCAFLTDITEKRRIEEKLNLIDFVFRNANVSIYLIKEDAQLYDINEYAHNSLGYTKVELMAMRITDLDPDYNVEIWKQHWNELKLTRATTIITKHKRKGGELMDVEITIRLIDYNGMVLNCSFVTDITEKKKIEERLKLLEKVVTETSQSIVIADATEGMDTAIIYANDAFTSITGYSVEEVKGMNPRFLHKDLDVRDDYGRNVMRSAIKNFIPWKIEVINTKKNGEHYWADISGFPVFNSIKGEYSHWVAIQSDITKRKEAELEREQMLNELIKNNLELKQFSFITTHNLRAPLTNLLSICKLIKPEKVTDSRTLKLIEAFKISTNDLNDTLNDLIKILIIKEDTNLETKNIDFEEWLNKAKTSINMKLTEEEVSIEEDFLAAPSINFSGIYLESIFLNLLTNAIKYRHPDRSPIIKIKTERGTDNSTMLTFSDNGIGMNMKIVKGKIFGLHQRFHENIEGKGMGLYLIHSQITALGGTIEVDSEEKIGTTFTIHFK